MSEKNKELHFEPIKQQAKELLIELLSIGALTLAEQSQLEEILLEMINES